MGSDKILLLIQGGEFCHSHHLKERCVKRVALVEKGRGRGGFLTI